MDPEKKSSLVTIPGAIIIAGAIIAVAIFLTQKPVVLKQASNPTTTNPSQTQKINMAPVTSADHILGNPNAPIKIVEYSDPSCPYCKLFFPTMQQVMSAYGASGQVAWVYRAYPLDKPDANGNILHPNAGHESQAMECADKLGGNTAFWAFATRLYTVTPSVTAQTPQGLDQSQLPVIAQYVGLDPTAFNSCLSSGQFKDKVEAQFTDGVNAGVSGTPYSIIVTSDGQTIPVVGAQSYDTMKQVIDSLLATSTQS